MKKLIYLIALFLGFTSYAQGILHIYNHSSYDIEGRLFANSLTNCTPEVFTFYKVPAGTMVDIKSFNLSNLATPPIYSWAVRTSTAPVNVMVPSGLLITMGNLARWHFYWFKTKVAGTSLDTGDPDFNMGDQHFCGDTTSQDYIHGVVTEAKWYYDSTTNETTIIVKDI